MLFPPPEKGILYKLWIRCTAQNTAQNTRQMVKQIQPDCWKKTQSSLDTEIKRQHVEHTCNYPFSKPPWDQTPVAKKKTSIPTYCNVFCSWHAHQAFCIVLETNCHSSLVLAAQGKYETWPCDVTDGVWGRPNWVKCFVTMYNMSARILLTHGLSHQIHLRILEKVNQMSVVKHTARPGEQQWTGNQNHQREVSGQALDQLYTNHLEIC